MAFHISARFPRCCNVFVTLPSQLYDRMPGLWTTPRSWDPCKTIGIPLVLLLSERQVAISETLVKRFPISFVDFACVWSKFALEFQIPGWLFYDIVMILSRLPANFSIGCHVFGRLPGSGYMQNHWYFIGFTAI